MEIAVKVFNVTVPVLLCALAGLFWKRLRMPFDNRLITPLLMHLAVPCLLLASFSEMDIPPSVLLRLLGATVLAHVLFGLLGWAFLRMAELDVRTYLSSMLFGNNGNLGLPLCVLAFGREGLYMGLGYMAVNTVGMFTAGAWINAGRLQPGELLRTPALYAAPAAVLLAVFGVQLPVALRESMDILGGMAIPLMLLALGAALSGFKVANLRRSLVLSLFKTAMGAGVALLLAWILGLEGVARDVFLLQSVMPVAVFNYLLAEHFGRDGSQVAGLIVVSSVLGLLVIPLALALLL